MEHEPLLLGADEKGVCTPNKKLSGIMEFPEGCVSVTDTCTELHLSTIRCQASISVSSSFHPSALRVGLSSFVLFFCLHRQVFAGQRSLVHVHMLLSCFITYARKGASLVAKRNC